MKTLVTSSRVTGTGVGVISAGVIGTGVQASACFLHYSTLLFDQQIQS